MNARFFLVVVNATSARGKLLGRVCPNREIEVVVETVTRHKFVTSIPFPFIPKDIPRADITVKCAWTQSEKPVVEPRNLAKADLVGRVKAILASKGLSLYQLSQRTKTLYGRSSPYFLPHNLYYDLGLGTFSPSLHQFFALSNISGYRFHDWLRAFGFDPEDIARLQVLLRSKRTLLVDSSLVDPRVWVPWFQNKKGKPQVPTIAPLGQFLAGARPKRLQSLFRGNENSFLYARIGCEDAFAFPDLLPGCIVRVDTRYAEARTSTGNGRDAKSLFLVEHSNGFCCCRVQVVGKNHIIPLSTQLPYAQVELKLQEEVRVLGVLDLEIRSLLEPEQPDVPKELAKHWRPLKLSAERMQLSRLLRHGRQRAGLSFREASAMSRQIAQALGDQQYFTAPGSLSDYEAVNTPPRHVHKAFMLCAVYGLHFSTFLESIGLDMNEAGKEPIPDDFVVRNNPTSMQEDANKADAPPRNGLVGQLLRQSDPFPFFLRKSIPDLSGIRAPSLNDFFWTGGEQNPLHPLLVNGILVIVNRQRKKPIYSRSKPLWEQPLYMVLRRNGTYLCACCSVENGTLVIHPQSADYQRPEQLRNHDDGEVIGQIVTVARRL